LGQGQTIAVNRTVADTSARAGLVDAVAGQDLREGEIGFSELDQRNEDHQRVGDDLADGIVKVVAVVVTQVLEGTLGVTADRGQHRQEQTVPGRRRELSALAW
jgi:hypothetical protein